MIKLNLVMGKVYLKIKNNWEFTEVWIDPMLSPTYILLLLCDSEENCQIYDPKQGDKVSPQYIGERVIQAPMTNQKD